MEHSDIPQSGIVWAFPSVSSHLMMFMLEDLTFKVSLKRNSKSAKVLSPDSLVVQAWTNIYHRENPQGQWHGIDLEYMGKDAEREDCFLFGNTAFLTSHGEYRVTYRARAKQPEMTEDWTWAGQFQEDAVVEVRPPANDRWTQGPDFKHIIENIYLGNFIAATVADELGFDAVINVADNVDLIPEKFRCPVLYRKIPMADGAHNPIPPEFIRTAVEWLCCQGKQCDKILVNSRAGIGRAGSTVVAYVFASNREMSFQEAREFVFRKRYVYLHKNLEDTVRELYFADR